MKLPTIGVVIATPGRASIYRTLRSIQYQGLMAGDDILVVGDGLHQPTKELVEAFGPPFRYVATRATRDWGHSQANYGLKNVRGDVVVIQDDDDIFLPRAFEEIRRLMAGNKGLPIVGRVKTPFLGVLWTKPGDSVLDGHCIVVPNDKKKLGFFGPEYDGDQVWIKTSLQPYGEVNWADRVWTLTRPTWKLFPRRVSPVKDDPYWAAFSSEIEARAPGAKEHEANGEHDWTWFFYTADRGPKHPVAALKLWEEENRSWASMAFVSGEGMVEVVEEVIEFASWAAQGQELWFGTRSSGEEDALLIATLRLKGYKDHMIGKVNSDFTLDWPPRWWEKPAGA